jgi:hypothetical protein
MNFIWNEPIKAEKNNYPKESLWDNLVIAWLNYNGVWPHIDSDHLRISYNYRYHFFDITIFECHKPGNGHPKLQIENMSSYLLGSKLDWGYNSTFRWDIKTDDEGKENYEKVDGVRFWIQAENFPNERQKNLLTKLISL